MARKPASKKRSTKKRSTKKKTAKRSTKRAVRKTASRKQPAKKRVAKKRVSRLASRAPVPVKTGRGSSAAEIGAQLVGMLRSGVREPAIWKALFHKDCISIEGGMGQAWHGLKAMQTKADWFYGENHVHSLGVEGPYAGATGFVVKYTIDVEMKATGHRQVMTEVGVYTVTNGKVIQEEFMACL